MWLWGRLIGGRVGERTQSPHWVEGEYVVATNVGWRGNTWWSSMGRRERSGGRRLVSSRRTQDINIGCTSSIVANRGGDDEPPVVMGRAYQSSQEG